MVEREGKKRELKKKKRARKKGEDKKRESTCLEFILPACARSAFPGSSTFSKER